MTAPSPFHEIQFPPFISYGASGGPGFNTTVLPLSSGFERRNINWSIARAEYDVAHGLKTQQELDLLIAFFRARFGKAYGFRFKDWSDYKLPNYINVPGDLDALPTLFTTVGLGGGNHSVFQLTKVYGDAVNPQVRIIKKPFSPGVDFAGANSPARPLALLNNGSPMTNPTDFVVDCTTGLVTLSAALSATTGHLITGGCDFMVPCRFDIDAMKVSITEYNNLTWGQIPIIEVRLA